MEKGAAGAFFCSGLHLPVWFDGLPCKSFFFQKICRDAFKGNARMQGDFSGYRQGPGMPRRFRPIRARHRGFLGEQGCLACHNEA